MLKAYMDESGTHDGSPVITVAACLGRPRQWQDWTKRWNATKRAIKVYHATDAANLHGEFENWTSDQVAALASKLLPQIIESNITGVVIGIHLGEFRKAMEGRKDLEVLLGKPYAACFQWVCQVILNLQAEAGSNERIAFIHECNSYQGAAQDAFGWVETYCNPQRSIVGLQFGDKATFTPLQAADILAFEANKRLRDPSRPERIPWRILGENVFVAHYGRENMHELVATLEKVKSGRISEIPPGFGWNNSHNPWWKVGSEAAKQSY